LSLFYTKNLKTVFYFYLTYQVLPISSFQLLAEPVFLSLFVISMQDLHFLNLTLFQFVDPLDVNFEYITRCLYWNYPCLIILRILVIKLCLHQSCKNIFFMIVGFWKSILRWLGVVEVDLHLLSGDRHQQDGYLACSYALLMNLRMQLSLLYRQMPLILLVFIHYIKP